MKKLAILGMASTWKNAPFDKPDEWEFWAINEMYALAPQVPNFKADRWFEVHDRYSESKNTPTHRKFLTECKCPVYMWQHYDDIPQSVRYPLDEVMNFFADKGINGARYHTESITWMVALALYEGYETIAIHGVDFANASEYDYQRPCYEYWIGIGEGMGRTVIVPQTDDPLKALCLYGFEEQNALMDFAREQQKAAQDALNKKAAELASIEQQTMKVIITRAEHRGAMAAYSELQRRAQ